MPEQPPDSLSALVARFDSSVAGWWTTSLTSLAQRS